MSRNLEIKARCEDLDSMRGRAVRIATQWIGVDHQVDTYFVTRSGRLKLRESSLSGGELIPYVRPDGEAPKRSDYQVIPVEDPEGLKELLTGLLGVHRVVAKEREIWLYQNVRIHLDQVEGLGTFIELEAVFEDGADDETEQQLKVAFLRDTLGIPDEDLVAISYEALLAGA